MRLPQGSYVRSGIAHGPVLDHRKERERSFEHEGNLEPPTKCGKMDPYTHTVVLRAATPGKGESTETEQLGLPRQGGGEEGKRERVQVGGDAVGRGCRPGDLLGRVLSPGDEETESTMLLGMWPCKSPDLPFSLIAVAEACLVALVRGTWCQGWNLYGTYMLPIALTLESQPSQEIYP